MALYAHARRKRAAGIGFKPAIYDGVPVGRSALTRGLLQACRRNADDFLHDGVGHLPAGLTRVVIDLHFLGGQSVFRFAHEARAQIIAIARNALSALLKET